MNATEYFHALSEAAGEAAVGPESSVCCRFDGLIFEIRPSSPSLTRSLAPALGHLRVAGTGDPDLTVRVHRGCLPGLGLPDPDAILEGGIAGRNPNEVNPVIYVSDDHTQGVFKYKTRTLSLFNRARGAAVHWLPEGEGIPLFERDRPLREILKWWLHTRGFMVLHAACVSHAGSGVLLVGGSGAGKSSVALSCLQSDFDYLGDEYVAVGRDATATAFCLYSSGRLVTKDAHRYPRLAPVLAGAPVVDPGKALLFLHPHLSSRIAPECTLRAIVALTITGGERNRIRETSPSRIVAACAPSTIFQQPGSGRWDLSAIADLARSVPCYALEAGTNRREVPETLRALVADLGQP